MNIAMSCGVGCRPGWDLVWLWLWQASSYSSDLTPSLGTSICCKCGPQKPKKKKELFISIPGLTQWVKDLALLQV